MTLKRLISALAITAVLVAPMAAQAGTSDPVSVKVNMARILRISAPAATVIIGNPGVADVTIQDPQTLILTGKSYGQTNLIVLDTAGNPVADTIVSVIQDPSDQVTVYLGAARTTFDCQPICQATVTLGDDNNFTSTAVTSAATLQGIARQQ